MSANTKIEWADHTFNGWEGCQKVGPGCDHCYAEARNARFGGGTAPNWGPGAPRRLTSAANWKLPRKWNAEAARLGIRYRVFCNSLADVFDNEVPTEWRHELFILISETPNLDWLLLTKRIGNVRAMLPVWYEDPQAWEGGGGVAHHNVWIGATIVNREEMLRDGPKLMQVPARIRFWSAEPLLGDLGNIPAELMPDWGIAGGESGNNARPMHPDWPRNMRDQFVAAGKPFLFKQWGEYAEWTGAESPSPSYRMGDMTPMVRIGKKAAGRLLDGRTWDEVPA